MRPLARPAGPGVRSRRLEVSSARSSGSEFAIGRTGIRPANAFAPAVAGEVVRAADRRPRPKQRPARITLGVDVAVADVGSRATTAVPIEWFADPDHLAAVRGVERAAARAVSGGRRGPGPLRGRRPRGRPARARSGSIGGGGREPRGSSTWRSPGGPPASARGVLRRLEARARRDAAGRPGDAQPVGIPDDV